MKNLEKLSAKEVRNIQAVKGGSLGSDIKVAGFEASADLSGANGQEVIFD